MIRRAPLVYVAGPFNPTRLQKTVMERTGENALKAISENVKAAEAAGRPLARMGLVPVTPHVMFRHVATEQPESFWYEATREVLRRCDAVFFMDTWKGSLGAQMEREEATRLKMPQLYSRPEAANFALRWFDGDLSVPGDLAVPGELLENGAIDG